MENAMNFTNRKLNVVRNLRPGLRFISDSQDVEAIKEHLGPEASGYDSFFVEVADGDYKEVWGMVGIVPHLDKRVSQFV